MAGERRVTVVRSPKSGVNFFSLGDFEEQFEMAFRRAEPAVRQVSYSRMETATKPWWHDPSGATSPELEFYQAVDELTFNL